MPGEEKTTHLNQFVQITAIASNVSVVVGVIVAMITVYFSYQSTNVAEWGVKTSTALSVLPVVQEDAKVREQTKRFLASRYNNSEVLHGLIEEKGSGEAAYDSVELTDLRETAHHYELLATLVRLNYLDFKVVFATIPFPEKFWDATERFRSEVRTQNWYGKGQGLPDFLIDSEYLRRRYEEERKKPGRLP